METKRDTDGGLVERRFGTVTAWQLVATALLALLLPLEFAAALTFGGSAPIHPAVVAEGLVAVLLVIPTFVVGVGLAVRDSIRGYLLWLGALGYVVAVAANYAALPEYTLATLVYLVFFSLSLFTLVGGLVDCRFDAVERAVADAAPRRLLAPAIAAVAAVLGAVLAVDLVVVVLRSLTEGGPIPSGGEFPPAAFFVEGGVLVPGLLVAAYLVWRGRASGYVLASVQLTTVGFLAASTLLTAAAATVFAGPGPSLVRQVGFLLLGAAAVGILGVLLGPWTVDGDAEIATLDRS